MILNATQLTQLKEYQKLVAEGKSKSAAADFVGVNRKTIARWETADNAPAAPKATVKTKGVKTKAAPKAKAPRAKKPAKKTPVVLPSPSPSPVEVIDGSIMRRIMKITAEQLGLAEADIKPESSFIDDLGADSLDTVELVMALEDEFEMEIPDEQAEKITTVRDAHDLIYQRLDGDKEAVIAPVAPANAPATPNLERVPFQSIVLPNSMTVVRDGKPVQIDKNHQNFEAITKIVANVKDNQIYKEDLDRLYGLIDMTTGLKEWSQGRIIVTDTGVKVDGKPLVTNLAKVMIRCLKDGDKEGLERFAKFHDKIEGADSFKVNTRLFEFVTKTGLRIDDDGDIIALKVVRNTYMDKHSNTFDNSPGKTVTMPRNQVNDDDRVHCSYGLHICAPGYIKHFAASTGGDRLVEVKVDPRDIVSVPTDYNFDKCRCCKYIVLKDVSTAYKKELYNV